jgi:hypothetical protein
LFDGAADVAPQIGSGGMNGMASNEHQKAMIRVVLGTVLAAAAVLSLALGPRAAHAAGDADGCPDEREQQTAVGTEATGGRRNY